MFGCAIVACFHSILNVKAINVDERGDKCPSAPIGAQRSTGMKKLVRFY